ncbi:MAG: hypothetical protein IJE26_01555 [Oscillospiraceae bacterium]|nr:hypothetical protein [Oscillospiraceae bacterium]
MKRKNKKRVLQLFANLVAKQFTTYRGKTQAAGRRGANPGRKWKKIAKAGEKSLKSAPGSIDFFE